MRRYKKKELLETVEMLVEANEVIGRLCKSNTERALEILGQCQESAILLGNLIESKGNGYAELIGILEDYCENIYQMSIAVSDEEQIRKLSKKIQKQLTYLNNKIRQEMPEDKKEVVFFPYKASMWDSLESVWMAADADEDTDAYVVPIPYYDKNPDGTFREMHYEGDQYPDYVPITNWEEYDFEERRPDVMFIHNPYDEFNYVTSVHPRFYSKNLKKFTEKLVYIPYFILNEIDPDDDAAIEGMKHFCINEAVKNADKVIVQSEDMRQVYIKVLTEESGGSKEARSYWEKKIDGSGSPKVDKVLRTKKEDLEIPEEWMKVIQKPDGSWKKIVFYNTSVTAILRHEEQMLKKIKSVFQTFQENKDEVALLWRPHPLIESTLVSMRPELWEGYRKIREKYREESWGIYDDTADMDRAVILSDAYYGDGSSIVQLYQKTGKAVMIQDANITNKLLQETDTGHFLKVAIGDAVIYKRKIWFNTFNFNALFCMDIGTGETVHVGKFPNETYERKRLYESMKLVGSKIYFAPFSAGTIAVYDTEQKEFGTIKLDEKQTGCGQGKPLFGGVELYGKYLYFLPVFSKAIVQIDTDSNEVIYITGWTKKVENLIFNKKDAYFRRQCVLVDNKLMIPFCNANAVLEFNCDTLDYMVYQLGTEERGYSGICYDGHYFWLPSRTSRELFRWNPQINSGEIIGLDYDGMLPKAYAYVGVLCQEKEIVVFSSFGKEKRIEMRDVGIVVPDGKYMFVKKEKDIWLYYRTDTGKMTLFNKEDGNKAEVAIKVKFADINIELLSRNSKDALREGEDLDIESLVRHL